MASKDLPPTVGGYDAHEVISALQKAIRRGEEDDALYWARELELSGHGYWAFKRLRVIACEDVGLADPGIVSEIDALHRAYCDFRKNTGGAQKLPLFHAVMLLCRAPKSRVVDWAVIAMFNGEPQRREVPEHALDKHTRRGKMRGANWATFFGDGTQLEPHAEQPDEQGWRARAWAAVRDEDERGPVADEGREPVTVDAPPLFS